MAHLFAAGITSLFGSVSAAAKKAVGGWGDAIEWMTLDKAMNVAKEENKMIIAVVHKENCPACNYLKKAFKSGKELQKLSKEFIMVCLSAEEVNEKKTFHPDGNYVPRVLFFDASGRLMPKVKREANLKTWRYNYATEQQVIDSMRKVLEDPSKYSQKN